MKYNVKTAAHAAARHAGELSRRVETVRRADAAFLYAIRKIKIDIK